MLHKKVQSERILKLLEEGTLLKEERNRVRTLSRAHSILQEKSLAITFDRYNSYFNNNANQKKQSFGLNHCLDTAAVKSTCPSHQSGNFKSQDDSVETESYLDDQGYNQMQQKSEINAIENVTTSKDEFRVWNLKRESNPLLDGSQENDSRHGMFIAKDDHPFNSTKMHVLLPFFLPDEVR